MNVLNRLKTGKIRIMHNVLSKYLNIIENSNILSPSINRLHFTDNNILTVFQGINGGYLYETIKGNSFLLNNHQA